MNDIAQTFKTIMIHKQPKQLYLLNKVINLCVKITSKLNETPFLFIEKFFLNEETYSSL
jgi:hypothetical protein